MVVLAVGAVSTTTFLSAHFRSITEAEDGERVYYALDAAVEAVIADVVRGADIVDPSYVVPTTTVNGITPTVTTTVPAAAATPTPVQQYFDPGVKNPELINIPDNAGYLMHILNVYETSTIDANWAFLLSGGSPSVRARIRLYDNQSSTTPGRTATCPGGQLINRAQNFTGPGPHNIRLDSFTISQPGVYSIAFCPRNLVGVITTEPAKLNGATTDTWVYAIAFKDYKIIAEAEGATVTTYVRQMPGPTQPPTGNWSDTNISWITNLVTPYQWDR